MNDVTPSRRSGLGPILLVTLIAAVGGGIWWSHQQQARTALPAAAQQKILMRGAVGSEKVDFFSDPRVQS
ncbi:hypothetical protein ABTM92_20065, partial [Acinetobacter baumannii]